MATIGELIINLNASTAAFVTELERVKNLSFNTSAQIQRSFSLIGTAALGMLGTFAGAMVEMVGHTVELETHILHLAAASGMSVESMSGLAFVAKMFGMEVDTVASALEKFDKQLVAAQLGNKKAEQNMSLLGIDPATITTSDQALMKLSQHFSEMPDGILKTGEAMLAFSKNGAQMLELLNQGPVVLQKYLDMARALGLVFDKEDAEAALHFEQNLKILHGSMEGFQIQLEKAVLPNLNQLTDLLVSSKKEVSATGDVIDVLKWSFQALAGTVVLVVAIVKEFGSSVKFAAAEAQLDFQGIVFAAQAMWAALSGDKAGWAGFKKQAQEAWNAATQVAKDGAKAYEDIQSEMNQRTTAIWGEGTKTTEAQQKAFDSLSAAVAGHQKAVDSLKKSVESIITTYQTNLATIGMTNLQITEYKLRVDAAKLGIEGWLNSELKIIEVLDRKKTLLDQLAVLDNSKIDAEKKNFLADKLQADKDDTAEMVKQLDLIMKLQVPQTVAFQTGPGDAFTASIKEQTAALEYERFTFGMTTQEIKLFNLAQLDSSEAAQKQIASFKALDDQVDAMKKHAKDVTDAWKEFGAVAERSLSDLIFSGKSFTQVLADITKQLGEMFLKWALFGFGNTSTKGGGGLGGLFGAIFGALGFAEGGAVSSNVPIVVGEKGPEIFMPGTSGTIIPNGAGVGAGGGTTIVYQIDARGSSITEAQFQRSLQVVENRAVMRALNASREVQLRTT